MVAKNLLVAAIFCCAFSTLPVSASDSGAPEGKTRAEVREELKQAQADGSAYCADSDHLFECGNRGSLKLLLTKKAPQIGRWLTQGGQLEIEIAACGEALCGTVVKAKENAADASSSAPPALGLKVLSQLTPVSASEWKGRIYHRGDGLTYDCVISLASPNELRIVAYKDTPANGKEQVWHRL
ncbi:MAG: DUF2147 domain-containing protein [Undibacterium sp.]|uniref:DUF2147 domain-containing protein n=1 Tax=Undibacterium sp. TaxID=1914977 RepID=UPI00271EA0F4|nr:DUF2147 domain-containing protein [Undibacterium sp.]MDO8653505.1 DUF2147 domain-containing protein [Undibacterium sp.]